jgi:phosphatidylserine decarboxylase
MMKRTKSESKSIDFLYGTALGRFLLRPLVSPAVSKAAAGFLSSPLSAGIALSFAEKNGISLADYEMPEGGYRSFNEFFTRKIKEGRREICEGEIVAPADGLLTVSPIEGGGVPEFRIKNTVYSIGTLLRDSELAEEFAGGTALIFRLTPAHYHRYSYCSSGRIKAKRRVEGILHSVKPVCHDNFPVFIENSREYVVIENGVLGDIVQMEVGALLVGKISNHPCKIGDSAVKGTEKGYFEYGGSSIVVLVRDGAKNMIKTGPTAPDFEIPVKLGEKI